MRSTFWESQVAWCGLPFNCRLAIDEKSSNRICCAADDATKHSRAAISATSGNLINRFMVIASLLRRLTGVFGFCLLQAATVGGGSLAQSPRVHAAPGGDCRILRRLGGECQANPEDWAAKALPPT